MPGNRLARARWLSAIIRTRARLGNPTFKRYVARKMWKKVLPGLRRFPRFRNRVRHRIYNSELGLRAIINRRIRATRRRNAPNYFKKPTRQYKRRKN